MSFRGTKQSKKAVPISQNLGNKKGTSYEVPKQLTRNEKQKNYQSES
jgi:hypothetical protein